MPPPRYAAGERFPAKPIKENPNMKNLSHLTVLLTGCLALTSSALGQQGGQDNLVQIVRNATQQYQNVANAVGYAPALGCVSGPDHGAMGIHYVNGSLLSGATLLANGQLDATKPQAIIYEPQPNGELKLVAVEFIILANALPANSAPQVEGHLMHFIDGPNRYGLPPFFELHVWAWRDNPQGPFVDWNNHVSCAQQ
ncbi:MAG: hypothetical protein WBX19_00145 [Terracidiphilus sp.]